MLGVDASCIWYLPHHPHVLVSDNWARCVYIVQDEAWASAASTVESLPLTLRAQAGGACFAAETTCAARARSLALREQCEKFNSKLAAHDSVQGRRVDLLYLMI